VREDGGWEMEVEMTPRQLAALTREAGVTRSPIAPCASDDASLQFRAPKAGLARH
jgi:hypothetical protein